MRYKNTTEAPRVVTASGRIVDAFGTVTIDSPDQRTARLVESGVLVAVDQPAPEPAPEPERKPARRRTRTTTHEEDED